MLKKWLYINELRTSVVTKVNKKHHKILFNYIISVVYESKVQFCVGHCQKVSVQKRLN